MRLTLSSMSCPALPFFVWACWCQPLRGTHIVEARHARWAHRHPPVIVRVGAPLAPLLLGLAGITGLSLLDLHLKDGE